MIHRENLRKWSTGIENQLREMATTRHHLTAASPSLIRPPTIDALKYDAVTLHTLGGVTDREYEMPTMSLPNAAERLRAVRYL